MAAEAAARETGVLVPLVADTLRPYADAAPLSLRWAGPKQAWFTIFLPFFQQRAVGRFSEGKPRGLRALRVRRRCALPLPSCQKLAVAGPVIYLSNRKNCAKRENLFLFTTRSLALTRDHEAKQAWFTGPAFATLADQ